MNWSGGKDAAYAYYLALQDPSLCVDRLITTIGEHGRVSMHGVDKELLFAQAKAVNLPIETIRIPLDCTMEEYGDRMHQATKSLVNRGYSHAIFGDIALEDLKQYRERMLEPLGISCVFPVWGRDTREQAEAFIDAGFRSVVVCVNGNLLDSSFAGRVFDRAFLADLPSGVDPCGENGEFHSFVFDGPTFQYPLQWNMGDVVEKRYPGTEQYPEGSLYYFRDIRLG